MTFGDPCLKLLCYHPWYHGLGQFCHQGNCVSGILWEDPKGHVRRRVDPTLWALWSHLGSQVLSNLGISPTLFVFRLMMDPMSGLNRGYAFITFTTREEALEAVKQVGTFLRCLYIPVLLLLWKILIQIIFLTTNALSTNEVLDRK